MKKPMITAHRGAAALRAENTVPAFRHAIELGVDELEYDVHLLKNVTVAVFHDFDLYCLTSRLGRIEDMGDAGLRGLRVRVADEAPRWLEELADLLAGKGLDIEPFRYKTLLYLRK